MLKKGTKIYSILTGNCPVCHKESMYKHGLSYTPSTITMHEHCSHCGTKYQMEPSFFYGAMYVSYAVGIAIGFVAFVISYLILKTSLKTSFISIIMALIVTFPIILRLSRNLWINMFMHYKKEI